MLLLSGPVDLATCFGVKLSFPGPPSAQYLAQLTEASESVDRKVVQVFEMGFPSSRSFTALANLHLPSSHVLHPDACNPAMDLVVLLGQTEESASTAAVSHLRQNGHSSKGKGKAEAAGYTTKIALWRMSGSRAWEVEVEGRVAGLAWSPDGTMLAKSPDHLLTDTQEYTSRYLSSGILLCFQHSSTPARTGEPTRQHSSIFPCTTARSSGHCLVHNCSIMCKQRTGKI